MRITSLETFRVPPRWLFLKVSTDEDIHGWGEPIVEGRLASTEAAVHELSVHLLGHDPLHIEDLWQTMTRAGFYRGGPTFSSAVAGVDQALWDIAGKVRGAPVHALLGGPVRDRVRCYAWVGGDDPSEITDGAQARLAQGFGLVKANFSGRMPEDSSAGTLAVAVRRAEALKEALGDRGDFALDFHGRLGPIVARRALSAVAPLAPIFVEEPVVPELAPQHMKSLSATTDIPLACGERVFSRAEFLPLLSDGLAVVQPDVSHAGGISETRRIAVLAETFGAPIALHSPLGPIALAASIQIDFATPNFLAQEVSFGLHYNGETEPHDYVTDARPLTPVDGYFERPTAVGLGITVDEERVRWAARQQHAWAVPVWRHSDGSLAEW